MSVGLLVSIGLLAELNGKLVDTVRQSPEFERLKQEHKDLKKQIREIEEAV